MGHIADLNQALPVSTNIWKTRMSSCNWTTSRPQSSGPSATPVASSRLIPSHLPRIIHHHPSQSVPHQSSHLCHSHKCDLTSRLFLWVRLRSCPNTCIDPGIVHSQHRLSLMTPTTHSSCPICVPRPFLVSAILAVRWTMSGSTPSAQVISLLRTSLPFRRGGLRRPAPLRVSATRVGVLRMRSASCPPAWAGALRNC
jgi:hypothetical protein